MAGGRPRKELDKKEFEKLCFLQCTVKEFESWFDITYKTLERWCQDTYGMSFSNIYDIKRRNGLLSLRRSQFQLAEKNAAMAIFLGKNMLGQTDKMEQTVKDVSEPKRITINFSDKKVDENGDNISDSV